MRDNYTEQNKMIDERNTVSNNRLMDINSIPFVLQQTYIKNHRTELKRLLVPSSTNNILEELADIRRELKRPIVAIRQYAKTKYAASYLNVDASFLTKRMGKVFIEGKHYFRPENESIVRWDLNELERWMRDEDKKDAISDFLSTLEV